MNFQSVIRQANTLLSQARFLNHIEDERDYLNALEMMDILVDDYDNQKPLIDILANSIEEWEERSEEFVSFNAKLKT